MHKREVVEERTTANELVSLHEVNGKGSNSWFFDGFICYEHTRHHFNRVPCTILSIGGFEDTDLHTVGPALWIQTKAGRELDVWYCLRSPSAQYERFHAPFLWLADLAKHLVDYLHNGHQIQLSRFRRDFHLWLKCTHGTDEVFQQWLTTYNDTDFRRIIAAHAPFLYNQAGQLGEDYMLHPLWDEIDPYLMKIVPKQGEHVKTYNSRAEIDLEDGQRSQHFNTASLAKTVVTPYVYECFRHLPWAKFLDAQHPSSALRRKHLHEKASSTVTFQPMAEPLDPSAPSDNEDHLIGSSIENRQSVQIGDVVAVNSDSHAKSKWKSNDALWYGYVQGITKRKLGGELKLIWLYRPADTACQSMKYPHSNELFLSDNCNCDEGSKYTHEAIYTHEVVSKPRVAFFGNPSTPNAQFFVRQKYIGADSAWVSLELSDFRCACKTAKRVSKFLAGTTLLVKLKSHKTLQAVEVVEQSLDGRTIRVRRLPRRTEYGDPTAAPNELLYTSRIEDIPSLTVSRPCHVRFYSKEEAMRDIPVPYCRHGTGDFYYITSCEQSGPAKVDLVPLIRPWPATLKQGFDPLTPSPLSTMRGLDIFCGGGSLGRGLEEGGAVKMEWAVDYFKQAIHTYRANVHDPKDIALFYGSVNDYLSQAMRGEKSSLIAQFGQVHFISAGSPCQGFSFANQRKTTDQSLINISMVASVVAFVDFYRPKYALLENVLGMAKCGKSKHKGPNVFAQILCALVGMGYQVRPYLLDAWNFGSPQGRTRIFISITAPGLTPLPDPPQSHSHPDGIKSRDLGKAANGLPFAERYEAPTPFKYITIKEATTDLPSNKDGKVDCIPFPDHRITRPVSSVNQTRIAQIPKHPPGKSFVEAANMGWMPKTQMDAWRWDQKFRSNHSSRAWKRVFPDSLLSTVTTACCPEDGISGQWLHWEADRPMTIMEARRAQGFPDHEVILGTPLIQWKIIGNSVARPVALALGVALRTAWLANEEIEAKASATHLAQGLEIARKTAILPTTKENALVPKSRPSNSKLAVSPMTTTGKPSAFKAAIRNKLPLTKTDSERLHSLSSIENPIVVSSDSEHSDSDNIAVFTPSTSKNTTRETTDSDIEVTKKNNWIEAQATFTSARKTRTLRIN